MSFFIIFLLCTISSIQAKPEYEVDVLDIEWNVTTPENFDMEWDITQPQRGIFAISGFADFKKDINTDKAKGLVNIYYSPNAVSYMLTPFRIPMTIFTDGMNFLYKVYMMEEMKNCCEDAIDFEGTFVAPLTKRRMVCVKCLCNPKDNFPTYMRTGFYKFEGISYGEIAFAVTLTVKLEKV
ncbi:uncharacterized protein LOC135955510 [Calliphora vicina]|uniref:uncharacterized protein LOC135955510 n=1 Tax=Calliphora vicina TaxID=7373 RepID=UPI00325B9AFE